MKANSHVLRDAFPEVSLSWEGARRWAERLFSRERMAATMVAVGAITAVLAAVGLVEYSLCQAMQEGSANGVGASVFGFF